MEESLEEEIRKKTAEELSKELGVEISSDQVRDILATYSKTMEKAKKRLFKDLNITASLYQTVRESFEPLLSNYLFTKNMGLNYDLKSEEFKIELEKAVAEKQENFLSTNPDDGRFPKKTMMKLREIDDPEVQSEKVLDKDSKKALEKCSPELLKMSIKKVRSIMEGILRLQFLANAHEIVEKEKSKITGEKLDSIIKEIKQKHETALSSQNYVGNRKKLEKKLKDLERMWDLNRTGGRLAKVMRETRTIHDKAFEEFYKKLESMKVFGRILEKKGILKEEERKESAKNLLDRTLEVMGNYRWKHFEEIMKKVPGRETKYYV